VVLYNPEEAQTTDIFIAKYDKSGNLVWAKNTGETAGIAVTANQALSIASDEKGSVYITGFFTCPSITFGDITLQNTSPSWDNVFIAKYDSLGNAMWAKNTKYGFANAVSTDRSGNAYIAGVFGGDSITFDSITLHNITPDTGTGIQDFFIVKYGPLGNVLWAKTSSTSKNDQGNSIATTLMGNSYVTGSMPMNGSIVFDSMTLVAPADSDPMFIVAYDSSGNVLCADVQANGGAYNNICVDISGNAIVTGYYATTPFVLGNSILPNTGNENAFVAKFNCELPTGIKLSDENTSSLQLHPNPFTTQAIIQYTLPDDSKNAAIIIYDILGRQRGRYALNNTHGQITVNANNLSSGVYLYSLNADGKTLATKKMVVQE
jgi:hypothetical protein